MKKIKFLIIIFILFIVYFYVANITLIPSKIILLSGENLYYRRLPGIKYVETSYTSNIDKEQVKLSIELLGKNVRDISVNILENLEVIPLGELVGLKLYTNGVLIVGMSEVENINHNIEKPYENLDIQEGDTILKVNNYEIDSIETLKDKVRSSNGESLNLTILKANGSIFEDKITPVNVGNNNYKLGFWVKDAATGVGTISFVKPENNAFAALGHGITDNETDNLIKIDSGEIVTAKILDIKKAEEGKPGEIKGSIINQVTLGTVYKNTEFGLYGNIENFGNLKIDYSKKVNIAFRNEIEEGDATILCSLDGNKVKEYKIKIEKIYLNNNENNKSMLIEIIDDELINKTGGIIRGLSGAPILQNGKLVGAVTNVLVKTPTKGYGVFADIMIKNLEEIE